MNNFWSMLKTHNHKVSLRPVENILSQMRKQDVCLVSRCLKDFWKRNSPVLFDFQSILTHF